MRTLLTTLALVLALATGALADAPCCGGFFGIGAGGGGGFGDEGSRPAIDSACYTGNAVDGRLLNVGFHPAFTLIRNIDNENPNAIAWAFDYFPADFSCASQDPACTTNQIMATSDTGVTLGTDNNVNANGEPYCLFAVSASDGFIATGSYVGNGTFFDLPLPFVPDAVLIFVREFDEGTTFFSVIDMADQGAMMDTSADWQDDFVTSYNVATEFTPPSITIRNGSATFGEANTLNAVYDYIVFNKESGIVDTGIYTGNGAATQVVVTECAEIEAVFIRPEQSTEFPCAGYRTAAMIPAFHSDINTRWIAGWQGTETGGITDLAGNTGSFTVNVNALDTIVSDCNETGALYAWFAICNGQTIASAAAFDPHTQLRAYYDSEGAAGTALTNFTGTQCGADCNFDDAGGVQRSTTEFREGLQSSSHNGTDEFYQCTAATCGVAAAAGTDLNIGTTMSWFGWARVTDDTNNRAVFYSGDSGDGTTSWRIFRANTNDRPSCTVTAVDSTNVEAVGADNSWPVNTWVFFTCVFNDTANTIGAYINAVVTGTPQTVASMDNGWTGNAFIARNTAGSSFTPGQLDSFGVYAGALTTAQMCYLASCGGDGTECTCLASNPAVYVNNGRNAQAGNCTLPACNTGGF